MKVVNIQPGYKGTEGVSVAVHSDVAQHKELYIPLHVGSVEYMERVFRQIRVPISYLSYIPRLKKFYNRDMEVEMGMGTLPELGKFVKPLFYQRFKPFVAAEGSRYPGPALVQELVKFDQEYRAYVIGTEVVGIGRYDDHDSEDIPKDQIEGFCAQVIEAWADRPAAFCIDVGRIEDRGLALVEITDAWACGLYKGVCPKKYLEMLQVRWDELISLRAIW